MVKTHSELQSADVRMDIMLSKLVLLYRLETRLKSRSVVLEAQISSLNSKVLHDRVFREY